MPHANPVIAEAKRKARYGHRYWICWETSAGWKNSRCTADSLRTALAESDADHIWLVARDDGGLERYGEGGLRTILKNLEAGHLGQCF